MNANAYVGGNTILNGNTTARTNLFVLSDTSMNGNSYVGGRTTLVGDISANSKLSLGSDLAINGFSTFKNDVTMNNTLTLGGNLTLNGNVIVNGVNTTFMNNAQFSNNLYVIKDVSLNGNTFINNDLSVNGNVTIGKYTKINRITEEIIPNATSSSPFTFDLNTGSVFYLSAPPAANFTCNFTNYPNTSTDANRSFVVTLIINSVTNKTYCNTLQVGGTATTLIYNGGAAAISVSSATVITQTLVFLNVSGSYPWRVMTSISSYQ
jgi:hypothetical protein